MGDIQRYLTRAKEWLEEGNRVKVTVSLRGRENLFPDRAFEKIALFAKV
jgi:translation initiation factor IF-3